MNEWARRLGVAGAAVGAVAAGVAVDRLTVSRSVRRQALLALDAAGPFGSLRGTPGTALAEDGTELYYEVDELDPGADGEGARPVAAEPRAGERERTRLPRALRRARRPSPAPVPTVVFSHGFCLAQDVWHFQRAALRGVVRAVYWDQRGHGRSGRGRGPVTVGQLGRDLKAVLDAAVPEGPVVLAGHSMGGMTVLALAAQYEDWLVRRLAGVALLATSSGDLDGVTYGFPAPAVRAVRTVLPGVLRALGTQPGLVDRGRRAAGELYAQAVRRYAFGAPEEVDPGVARFAERLITAVPMDVVASFYPAFGALSLAPGLRMLGGLERDLPTLVVAGERDAVTPAAHGERIAAALPGSECAVLPGAGHLLLLERPDAVNEHLARLVARSIRFHEPAD